MEGTMGLGRSTVRRRGRRVHVLKDLSEVSTGGYPPSAERSPNERPSWYCLHKKTAVVVLVVIQMVKSTAWGVRLPLSK